MIQDLKHLETYLLHGEVNIVNEEDFNWLETDQRRRNYKDDKGKKYRIITHIIISV